jgi:hypothetical protein
VGNPTITLNGASLSVPVELAPGWYLEYTATGFLREFDGNGFPQPAMPPAGSPLTANQGANDVAFSCERGIRRGGDDHLATQDESLNCAFSSASTVRTFQQPAGTQGRPRGLGTVRTPPKAPAPTRTETERYARFFPGDAVAAVSYPGAMLGVSGRIR